MTRGVNLSRVSIATPWQRRQATVREAVQHHAQKAQGKGEREGERQRKGKERQEGEKVRNYNEMCCVHLV